MKRLLIILGFVALVFILSPLFIYWGHFGFSFSNKYSDWVSFGDYLSGTVNTIVAVVNLFVLAWITYIIAKNSSEESRKQQFLIKRMEVHEKLSIHVSNSLLVGRRIEILNSYAQILIKQTEELEVNEAANFVQSIREELTVLIEMYMFVRGLETFYSHLFEYDFECEEFKQLILGLDEFYNKVLELEQSIINNSNETVEIPEQIAFDLIAFVESLKKEISLDYKR